MPTKTKLDHYTELLAQSVKGLNDSGKWLPFLETASRLYKYKFRDQVMIHAQRPNATACADYNLWKRADVADRQVKQGSKGIALLDDSGNRTNLRYVFDYADTEARSEKKLFLWQITNENENKVLNTLGQRYEAKSGELPDALRETAKELVNRYGGDYANELIDCVEDTLLEELDDFNVWVEFSEVLENSIAYSLLARCGYDASAYFEPDDFRYLRDFNGIGAMTVLGRALSELTEQALRDIERTVKTFERNKHNEQNNHRETAERSGTDVHAGRGNGDVSADVAGNGERGTADNRVLRTGEGEIPQRAKADEVRDNVNVGDVVPALDGNGQDGAGAGRTLDSADDEVGERGRETEIGQSNGMGGADEQLQTAGAGGNSGRGDIQLGAETVAVFNKIPTQNFNRFALAFPKIADGSYQSMTFKNADKKQLDVWHDTTNAGIVHVDLTYYGKDAPYLTRDPSFAFRADFEKRRLEPLYYLNTNTGEDVNVMSVPLELQNLTAAEKEFIMDEVALKIYALFADFKQQGFELVRSEPFFDEAGRELPAEPRKNLAEFLEQQAAREVKEHGIAQGIIKPEKTIPPEHLAAVLKYDEIMNAKKPEILNFFLEHGEPKQRAEFMKAAYNHHLTPVRVDNLIYEYQKTADGLDIFFGDTDDKTSITWENVQAQVADLIAKHEYLSETPIEIEAADPAFFAPKNDQLSLFGDDEIESVKSAVSKKSVFSEIDEQIIKTELLGGSGFEDGKFRIESYAKTNPDNADFAKFLRDEYGTGGHSGEAPVKLAEHGYKGITLQINDENGERQLSLNWNSVAKRIEELVRNGEYITDEDISRRIQRAEYVLNNYDPSNADDLLKIEEAEKVLALYGMFETDETAEPEVADIEDEYYFKVGDILELDNGIYEDNAKKGGRQAPFIFEHIDDFHEFFTENKNIDLSFGKRIPGINWWAEELPTAEEIAVAKESLAKYGNKVDYIFTHTPLSRVISSRMLNIKPQSAKQLEFFDWIEKNVEFNHWWSGHRHEDFSFDDRHVGFYNQIRTVD